MARRNAAASTSVEDKLRELGVDEDGEQLDEHEEESEDEESDDEEDDEDEHDDEGEDDESTSKLDALASEPEPRLQPTTKRSKLRDALFAEAAGPRPSRPAPPRAPSARTSEPSPLPLEREDPVYVVPPPRMRKTKQEASPGVKRLGPALAKKLPGAERIKIRKRMENGQLGLVGEYSIQDLAASSDVESFIFKHIKPKFGAGVYKLTGIDAAGNELDAGEIPILEPENGGANDPLSVMAQMFERQAREQKEMMEQRMAGTPDTIGMLKGLHEVQQSMASQVPLPKDNTSDLAAMMTMMMQMQAQQAAAAQAAQQQMTQLLVAAMQPREDPTMKALLAKLVEEKTSGGGGGASMPLPPMPPPSNPFEGMKEMMEVMVLAMGGNKKDSGDAELKELVKAALAVKKEESLSPRDWIALMRDVQTTKSDDDSTFRKSMEHMGMVLQVATNLRSQTEGSGSATFFDALSSLFSNRDFAGSIAQSIRSKSETAAQQQLLAQQQQLIREKQALVNQLRARAPQPVVAAPPAPANVVQMHRPPAVPVTAPVVPVAVPVPAATVAAPPPAAVTEAAAQAVETAAHAVDAAAQAVELTALSQVEVANDNAPKPKAAKIPPLPVATYEHLNGIVAAKDDGTLIQNTVRMLIYFAEFPDWRPLTEMLLGMVQAGEKRRSTKTMTYIFQGLSAMGMLAQAQSDRIIKAFVEHFDDIQQGISDLPLAEEERNAFTDVLDDTDEDEDEEEDEDEDEDEEEGEDEDDDEEDDEDDAEEGSGVKAKPVAGS